MMVVETDLLNLGDGAGAHKLAQINTADTTDEAQVEVAKSQSRQIKAVESTGSSNGQESLKLLELEERVEVEAVDVENI
ncbi:hypothetical protein NLG97_g4435 [Lecanicillium saksenae]|uniref:Uncharacterized protein n=1 Tax=Lecanicillium saksenae TaxID=468837 RepID=A0ACC1QVH2_9HYPO|nr:hypothetical protein NLG97_g4435 [Lecanicillium saksenae]